MVASKQDAISAIMGLNPTANPTFLAEFSKDDLEQYLSRLGRVIDADDPTPRLTQDLMDGPERMTPTEGLW